MKRQSPTRPPAGIDPALLFENNLEELDMQSDENEPYSDEFLDEFMREGMEEDDDFATDYGHSRSMKLDGDDDFDSFFRDSEGYSHSRRQRRHRGRGRHARDTFEFEPFDRSDWRAHNQRRPRR